MKNVGILTYHSVANFGANLQVLSTFNYLKKQGYNPIVINYIPKELEEKDKRNTPPAQYDMHQLFCQEHLSMSEKCRTAEEIATIITERQIESVIVGSDAVAQHHTFKSRILIPSKTIVSILPSIEDQTCPNPFWGTFNDHLSKKVPVAMMSVSNQNSNFKLMPNKEREVMSSYASKMKYISTRDKRTSAMFSLVTNGNMAPPVTPDPVFGFNSNIDFQLSEETIREKFGLHDKYILLCFEHPRNIDMSWLTEFKEISSRKGYECVAFPLPGGVSYSHPFDKKISLPLSPLEWYALIKYSSGYVGCNMHPIVVGLSNAVPCCSFDNYGVAHLRIFIDDKSSKIYHIMKEFGVLENRFRSRGFFQETPSPSGVLGKLVDFPKDSVKHTAEVYNERYMKMMQDIMRALEV